MSETCVHDRAQPCTCWIALSNGKECPNRFFKVGEAANRHSCSCCGELAVMWTLTYEEDGEEMEWSTSWFDREHAEDMARDLNHAFEMGRESAASPTALEGGR